MRTLTNESLIAGSLLERQIETETAAVHNGVLRYRRLAADAVARGDGAGLKAAERVLAHWWDAMVLAIGDELDQIRDGKYGCSRATAGPVVRMLSPDKLAYITMHEAVSSCMAGPEGVPMRTAAYAIGRAVFAEIHLANFKETDRETWALITQKVRALNVAKINRWAKKKLSDPFTDQKLCVAVGGLLIGILIDTCHAGDWMQDTFRPAFERETRVVGPLKKKTFLTMTDTVRDWIAEGHTVRETMRPRYQPMVVQPYPWTDAGDGGYVRIRTPFVSKPTGEQKRALHSAKLDTIREGLQAVSATPMRINRRVLAVVEEFWKWGGGFISIPLASDFLIPPRPDCTDEAVVKHWKKQASELHGANARLRGARAEFLAKRTIAADFAEADAIWFPHQLDFRSRSYPIPVWLNWQGDDVCRGLLEFAEAVPVTSEGRRWQLIHAANVFGLDKAPFDDRVQWAEEHMDQMREAAEAPLVTEWWRTADKPWQFLAACIACTDPKAGEHSTVTVDGTCNGLQHYAAMTRDRDGGRAVNLIDTGGVADVYAEGAMILAERVKVEAERGDARAIAVRNLIDRKLTKGIIMPAVYGVTVAGAAEHVRERLAETAPDMADSDRWKCAHWLAKQGLESFGQVCTGAVEAMEWIRTAARRITKANRKAALCWTTPLGFPVVQPYRRWRLCYVDTVVGKIRAYDEQEEGLAAMRGRQINGSAPNLVHSLDATHKFRVAIDSHRAGRSFIHAHDAFTTHASHVPATGVSTRERFVELHETPYLEILAAQWEEQHPTVKLPTLPKVGTLNIRDVLSSPYFFS
jgi:DNA-directed RNA polymerase